MPTELTVCICTGYRCTYEPHNLISRQRNPLAWVLSSLSAQVTSSKLEILIVDQRRDENGCVPSLLKNYQLKHRVSYIPVSGSTSLAEMRNLALEKSSSEFLYFLDDDAVPISQYTLQHNIDALKSTRKKYANVAFLQSPVYRRRVTPNTQTPLDQVGLIDFDKGILTHNFDFATTIPRGAPHFITNSCLAQAVVDVQKVLSVGGFKANVWGNPYGEESELSSRLVETGFLISFNPAHTAAVVHFKHGSYQKPSQSDNTTGQISLPGGYMFHDLAKESNRPLSGVVTRQGPYAWRRDYIAAFFCLFATRTVRGANTWLQSTYEKLILEDALDNPFVDAAPDLGLRKKAAREGLENALLQMELRGQASIAIRQLAYDFANVYLK